MKIKVDICPTCAEPARAMTTEDAGLLRIKLSEEMEQRRHLEKQIARLTAPAPDVVIVREWICVLKRRDARSLPVGTRVLVVRDDATMLETVTLAPPRDFGGQPVVDVAGIFGPYCMHRVYCPTG